MVPIACLPAGKPGLCECKACDPLGRLGTATIDRNRVPTEADILAYLDKLPRAQWAHADVMLRATFRIGKAQAVAAAKAYLRTAFINVRGESLPAV